MSTKRRVAMMIDLGWHVVRHHHVFSGIHRYAREKGHWEYSITPHADLVLKSPRRGEKLDGIVARVGPGLARLARRAKVPMVNVWVSSPVKDVPTVAHDAEEGGRMAARHLMARGFTSFGYLGVKRDRGCHLQLRGFRSELARAGFSTTECWVAQGYALTSRSWDRFQAALERWIDRWTPPTGVLAAFDLVARYLGEACHRRGLKVPHQVALVGTYNESVICNKPEPTLSSIDFQFERIGYQAAKLLDELMDGGRPPKEAILMPPMELVARQSSDAYVVTNEVVARALRFIAEHAHLDIDVESVASHVAATRRTLARYFQSSLGKTVADTITAMRLERIKREMADLETPLKTLAVRCGFRDAMHLCKVFQRVEGMTPTEFRALRQAKMPQRLDD